MTTPVTARDASVYNYTFAALLPNKTWFKSDSILSRSEERARQLFLSILELNEVVYDFVVLLRAEEPMDKNKAAKIVELGLSIGKCCGTCANFEEGYRCLEFGTCLVHTYFHEKHKEERNLSVAKTHFCSEKFWICRGVGAAGYLLSARAAVGNDDTDKDEE